MYEIECKNCGSKIFLIIYMYIHYILWNILILIDDKHRKHHIIIYWYWQVSKIVSKIVQYVPMDSSNVKMHVIVLTDVLLPQYQRLYTQVPLNYVIKSSNTSNRNRSSRETRVKCGTLKTLKTSPKTPKDRATLRYTE